MRIAVVSSDGERIGGHLGRAGTISVLDVDENGETTAAGARPGLDGEGHDTDALSRFLSGVSDCSFVLAGNIGPRVQRALAARNISAIELTERISDTARRLAAYERRRRKRAEPQDGSKNGGTL
ncbi:MAG: hypothetical protein LBS51_08725 [Oscillospiraceae bacterium]|jgi:predicted Fe-Mo cluster-binding NifX family protein|nr:hypothetical protein [Oscillospiraceae bacterium]